MFSQASGGLLPFSNLSASRKREAIRGSVSGSDSAGDSNDLEPGPQQETVLGKETRDW